MCCAPGRSARSRSPEPGSPNAARERFFGTRSTPRPPVSPDALALHGRLIVTDLHADSPIWRRDVLDRSDLGHFDFTRMAEGGGAVQGFLMVTESPMVINGGGISDKSDQLTAHGIVDQWPLRAILDQTERALYLGGKLHRFAERSGGTVRLIRTAKDLATMLAARRADPAVRGADLGLEGADGTGYGRQRDPLSVGESSRRSTFGNKSRAQTGGTRRMSLTFYDEGS